MSTQSTQGTQSSAAAPSLLVFGVGDLTAAKALYTAILGVEAYVDSPYYVGYRVGDVEVGLDPNAARQGATSGPSATGPITYWTTEDLEGRVDALVAAGATVQRPPTDVGGGQRVAVLADASGNLLGLREG